MSLLPSVSRSRAIIFKFTKIKVKCESLEIVFFAAVSVVSVGENHFTLQTQHLTRQIVLLTLRYVEKFKNYFFIMKLKFSSSFILLLMLLAILPLQFVQCSNSDNGIHSNSTSETKEEEEDEGNVEEVTEKDEPEKPTTKNAFEIAVDAGREAYERGMSLSADNETKNVNELVQWSRIMRSITDVVVRRTLPEVLRYSYEINELSPECSSSLLKAFNGVRDQQTWALRCKLTNPVLV